MENNFPADVRAALIDMDGVLYDSMPGHARAWHRMFKEYGLDIDPQRFFLFEGMTGTATIRTLMKELAGRDVSDREAHEMYRRKAELFIAQGGAAPMPGAADMLRALRSHSVRCVLVTGSAQNSLLSRLDKDYPGVFAPNDRVTALDVVHGKPDPEPYLKGLAIAGTDPRQTIVIENAPLGVTAGRAAGLFTVAVTTGPVPREEFVKADASAIFPSMPDFASRLPSLLER